MTRYYIEDTPFKPKEQQRLMRFQRGEFPEEYDVKSKQWVTNKELLRIYYGGIECDPITEKEVEEIINARNGKGSL